MNILADPVFSEKCGPAGFGIKLGNTRFTPPACQVEDLPPIDVVIISHNHHDHLDSQSVMHIARLHLKARWLVGLGNKKFCIDKGCANVEEMEWWQSTSIGSLRFSLWCGWVVESPKYKYYFAGDTGYQDELFQLIGRKYGPSCINTNRFITKFESVNPEEAVEVHKDILSKVSIGIHWGTFELTNEFFLEPPQELEKQMYYKDLDPKTFFNLRIGETWIVGEDRDYGRHLWKERKREHRDSTMARAKPVTNVTFRMSMEKTLKLSSQRFNKDLSQSRIQDSPSPGSASAFYQEH
ncbi:NAPEP-like protein [Mya arenaria]|uniref:NAPEP-like protein n=1 Tax=Mya arenaria TaxID=6604 RepID=A0ABY7ESV5_MYAAR|nr:NAPEP-like protein [Mya arenaria]